jgi:hypothetical protein
MQYPADVKLRCKKFTIYWWKTEIHNLSLSSVKLTTATCDSYNERLRVCGEIRETILAEFLIVVSMGKISGNFKQLLWLTVNI